MPISRSSRLRRIDSGWSAHQVARRSLLIRSVATRPSGHQLRSIDPPRCPQTLRSTSLVPYPPGPVGSWTSGPPRSLQTTTTSASCEWQETSSTPEGAENAPYLSELVASSCTTSASTVVVFSPMAIRGAAMRVLLPNRPCRRTGLEGSRAGPRGARRSAVDLGPDERGRGPGQARSA